MVSCYKMDINMDKLKTYNQFNDRYNSKLIEVIPNL